jgi:two-component system, OmpR family, KDP operon response regulator KdpE
MLVIEDEAGLDKEIRASLVAGGFAVEEVGTGKEALGSVQRRAFDLVLLDMTMQGLDGVETCRQIRALAPHTGIVVVIGRDVEADRVRALEAGADDYVTKPLRFREFMGRLAAVVQRTQTVRESPSGLLKAGDLLLDLDRRSVWKKNVRVHLSRKEFALLAFLMRNQGVPITHITLLRAVWGPDCANETEYVRTYIRMLRKKIEDDPANPQYILTEAWVGYRFENPAARVGFLTLLRQRAQNGPELSRAHRKRRPANHT